MKKYHHPPPRAIRAGFSLVEVIVSFVVFAVAILGAISLLIFGLKTVDDAKALNQATQILMNEMEAMRMRSWTDQTFKRSDGSDGIIHGLKTMGTGFQVNGTSTAAFAPPGGKITRRTATAVPAGGLYLSAATESTFTPYAVYGEPPKSGKTVATLGEEIVLDGSPVQMRAANGYLCTRLVELGREPLTETDVNTATVTLTIAWTDSRGISHSRFNLGYMSKNGINDYIYRSFPIGAK